MTTAATHPGPWHGYIILGCGAAKRTHRAAARDLYTGSLFRAAYAWAASVAVRPDRIVILSAKHGLVPAAHVLDPYDLRMGQPGSVTVSAIRRQADTMGVYSTPAIVVAGAEYCHRLAWAKAPGTMHPLFADALPAGKRGLGYQIGWLRHNVGRLPAALHMKGAA